MNQQRKGLDLGVDISAIQPSPVDVSQARSSSRKVTAGTGFERPVNPAPIAKPSRRQARGRTEQFTTRLTPETYAGIYRLADKMQARAIAEVLEVAIADLEAKLNR